MVTKVYLTGGYSRVIHLPGSKSCPNKLAYLDFLTLDFFSRLEPMMSKAIIMTINATTEIITGEKSTNISIIPAPTAGAYLWLFNRPKMLDDQLDLPVLEVRYGSA